MPVDPLATERLRTIITDATAWAWKEKASAAGAVLDAFPDAHFEYRTNEHGVRVRRIVAEGVWEAYPDGTDGAPMRLFTDTAATGTPGVQVSRWTPGSGVTTSMTDQRGR